MDDRKEHNISFDTEELSAEEQRVRTLVRMNCIRRRAAKPDADLAWEAFRQKQQPKRSVQRRFSWGHLSVAAIVGAAAMLAIVFLLQYDKFFPATTETAAPLVALQYDNTPQQIRLEEEGSLIDLPRQDSASYLPVERRVVAKSAQVKPKQQRLSTPRGMDFKVTLPDGSEVWLNAESTIEFPTAFMDGVRQVKLRGEAYFKVVRDEQLPFIVTSEQMQVRVLGTEFNFKSYATEKAYVTLVDGKVEVMRPDSPQPDATLKPGEEAWFDETGTIQVRDVDLYAATQWVNGFFYFDNQPLVDVLRELGRWYNLGVVFCRSEAMHYKVHFSALRNESVEMAIESLNRLRRVTIRIEENNMVVY